MGKTRMTLFNKMRWLPSKTPTPTLTLMIHQGIYLFKISLTVLKTKIHSNLNHVTAQALDVLNCTVNASKITVFAAQPADANAASISLNTKRDASMPNSRSLLEIHLHSAPKLK